MKFMTGLFAMISLIALSCSRNSTGITQQSFDGKWRMIMVKQNVTGSMVTKPASIQGEVEITFTIINASDGFFTGYTPTNEIDQNTFTIGPGQSIAIRSLSMTKVMETSWGAEFVNNIRNSNEYSFNGNNLLSIKTATKTLIFQRL